jgi:ankyrin repeat protein
MRIAGRNRVLACALCAGLVAFAAQGSDLADAARHGDTVLVKTLLESAARSELNAAARDGMTPLLWAAQANDLDIARALLRAGADASLANRYGITPLWLAAINRSPELVTLLLEHGADAGAALPHGETPLMAAARAGDAESIRLLIAAGADPNAAETKLGETALMWAAAEDQADAIRALVAGGADTALASHPLELAPMNWLQIGMVSTVLPVGGWPPLLYAGRENAGSAALALIEAGADPDIRDPDGLTALNVAIMNQHYDLAISLVEAGADPDAADRTGMTALYGAVEMARVGGQIGRPAVPRSSEHDAVDFARVALAHGADPDAALTAPILAQHHGFPDRSMGAGTTPLMRAARGHDLEFVSLLLEAGASIAAQQADGSSVLHVMGAGRPPRTDADRAVQSAVLDTLLAAGAELEGLATDGQTPLHRAARGGNGGLINALHERGARLDVRDGEGRTAYDLVAAPGRGNNPEIAALLQQLAGG